MIGIGKSFLQIKANQNVDLELYPGEVVALLGENGAGKSTLMKILFGLYRPDEGSIFVRGEKRDIATPKEAINLGIGMVHQHFNLVNNHQVWENILLGMESGAVLNKAEACRKILDISEEFGLKVDPEAYVWQLAVGEKQRVEIVKALFRKAEILVLDEPTAVLTPQESDRLFTTLKEMVKRGLSIIFITHKLKEVMSISDRAVVLRRGTVVGSVRTAESSVAELAELMVGGEEYAEVVNSGQPAGKKELLRVEGLFVKNDLGHESLKDVSLEIHEGEILGVAGVSGNGQKELGEILCGMQAPSSGTVSFDGKPLRLSSPATLIRSGFGRIPEDRMGEGLILNMSVAENLLLEVHSDKEFNNNAVLRLHNIKNYVDNLIRSYDVRPPISEISARSLSGGNIQKLILARELYLNPRLIIAAQPTRGLDVKAMAFIQTLLMKEKQKGTSILLISEDLDEIMNLSDRIAVMYEGEIVDTIPRHAATRPTLGLMMTGAYG